MSTTSSRYEYEGHLFIVYDQSQRGKVPKRLAQRGELRLHRGPNPERWDYRTHRPVRFSRMAA
ncbi:Uu.00g016350.m01.CDS01 [Anthostomella pinea]|uniref:Uu.00g016350.m01.CDS01 n=1 Tax=Anthostomella pinea TaxID=933095 RepID=A0AAI8VYQ6_9PEZI|nr:Uu.00g016350.m01.CDS01 [Anthostomella pinea]